jgi:N-acetylglucosaminyldiphosphoundecaprenol N-acetyl-beta-D-mannosaminyltransferase
VHPQTLREAVDTIDRWVEGREPNYVCITGVHGVIASQDDADLRRIHNEAGMVTTDGMPLVWLSRRLTPRGTRVERVYGPDLMLAVLDRSETTGWRHFFYGSTRETLERLEANVHARFPRARLVGSYSPPFRPLTEQEEHDLAERIEVAAPDIVWVGLSTPKQERWMAEHVDRLAAPVLVGVGAAFDFHAGVKRQAPRWMQRSGLEWAYRVGTEPRRLAGRYVRSIPRFVWLLAKRGVGKPRSQ